MHTAFVDPQHTLPCTSEAPTLKDPLGGGSQQLRSQYTRVMHKWTLDVPALQQRMDPFIGFLEYLKGDTPFWFDGAEFGEITEKTVIFIGDGHTEQVRLPHRHVYASTIVAYVDDTLVTNWSPIGDGITCEAIEFTGEIPLNGVVTAKYKRRFKCVVETSDWTNTRMFRNATTPWESLFHASIVIAEIAN